MPKPELTDKTNGEFPIRGVNHLALVCKDMQRTVDFYSGVLGMPLIKTIELPNNMGQHFFFDMGNGDSLAFFWFPNAPEAAPGVAAPAGMPGMGEMVTAHGSMNHIAFDIPADRFDETVDRLRAKGVKTSAVLNHDNSPQQVARQPGPGVFVRSIYFQDPDGILLEFASWTAPFTDADVAHSPATSADAAKRLAGIHA